MFNLNLQALKPVISKEILKLEPMLPRLKHSLRTFWFNSAIKRLQSVIRSYLYLLIQIGLKLWRRLILAVWALLPASAFAQTGGVAKFQEAAKKITEAIQQISGVAVLLLLVAGFGLLMWGGISENFRVKAVRIITYCIIGAACLFLFAQPLAEFLTATFGANGTTA